jgi:N-acetylmuramoyl-L-alanine amidase
MGGGKKVRRFAQIAAGLAVWVLGVVMVQSQDLSALARFDPEASAFTTDGEGLEINLSLSQPVPWRVRVLGDPARLVLDLREVDWRGIATLKVPKSFVSGARAGTVRPGWSRLVVELSQDMVVSQAEMRTRDGAARVILRLDPATPEAFARAVAEPDPPGWALPVAADLPNPKSDGSGPITVVLDPGHGGIDPGAERDGQTEADLMLAFARELKEVLLRDGRFKVVLTRDEDVFVPLETRISIARVSGAAVFLSLHADALAEGEATGTTIYTLSDDATDAAAVALAERHRRDDLLSGVDLTEQDDQVAAVLMDMARTSTMPRIDRLADALAVSIKAAGIKMHRHPRQFAGFSVLKAPDIPSVLIELGFLSSAKDLARLEDKDWRAKMAAALRNGLIAWAEVDAALTGAKDG